MAPTAIDLFGGAGGLTAGLKDAGFDVLATVDSSALALEAYKANHPEVRLWRRDIRRLDPLDVARALELKPGHLDLLAGCPPCQGFSAIRTRRRGSSVEDKRNGLVAQLARWTEVLRPKTLMMENVPGLADDVRLKLVLARLMRLGYSLTYGVLDAADYGVPQRRRRFVLLGAHGDAVPFAEVDPSRPTVRQTIGDLARPEESKDPLHNHGEKRSPDVMARIAAVPPEGTFRTLRSAEQLDCHQRTTGFYDIYGRMVWDKPAPTITGGCINPSKGRFLHPDQNRAITLREAALLQSFSPDYVFPLTRGKYKAAELIGNALPPRFVECQARQLAARLAEGRAAAEAAA